jgi:hypothetical protein
MTVIAVCQEKNALARHSVFGMDSPNGTGYR